MHIFVSLFHSFIRSFVFQTTQWMSLTGQTTCWAWRLDSGKESHNVVGKLCKKNLQMLTCAVHHHPQEDVLFILCWCDRVRAQMSLEIGKCFSLPSLLRKVLIMWLCLDSSQSFFQADTLIQRSLCSCLCLIIRSIKLDWIAIERNQCFTIWNYTWAIVILLIQVLSPKIITDCLFILQILAKKKKNTPTTFHSSVCVDQSFSPLPQVHGSHAMVFVNAGEQCRICFSLVPPSVPTCQDALCKDEMGCRNLLLCMRTGKAETHSVTQWSVLNREELGCGNNWVAPIDSPKSALDI